MAEHGRTMQLASSGFYLCVLRPGLTVLRNAYCYATQYYSTIAIIRQRGSMFVLPDRNISSLYAIVIYTCVFIYAWVCVCIYIRMCICVCICMYITYYEAK